MIQCDLLDKEKITFTSVDSKKEKTAAIKKWTPKYVRYAQEFVWQNNVKQLWMISENFETNALPKFDINKFYKCKFHCSIVTKPKEQLHDARNDNYFETIELKFHAFHKVSNTSEDDVSIMKVGFGNHPVITQQEFTLVLSGELCLYFVRNVSSFNRSVTQYEFETNLNLLTLKEL